MRPPPVRIVIVVAITAWLLAVPALARTEPGTKVAGTTVTVFRAFTATGAATLPTKSVSGYCWTGSIAADRSDAWRCLSGHWIYDPCFSSPAAPRIVLCPNMHLTSDVKIRLTRPLPGAQKDRGTASIHSIPWLIELDVPSSQVAGGVFCEFSTGASSVAKTALNDVRLNYYCSGGSYSTMGLWGLPARTSPQWTIRITAATAKTLALNEVAKTLKHAHTIALRHVWM